VSDFCRIDDIQDSSKLRRGQPVAHSIFGIAQTINSANSAYFEAQHELHKLNDPRAIQIFTEELLRLHRGQGMDLYWRDTLTCPSEEEYLEMVADKTGGLFRLAIKLMQCSSNSKQ
jgi:geranylgeranyl pyrophosphate synthase